MQQVAVVEGEACFWTSGSGRGEDESKGQRKLFYSEDRQVVEQAAQGGYVVSICGCF